MKLIIAAALAIAFTTAASAQQAVPPRWNWQGSAVCPEGFDFYAGNGLCVQRGYSPRRYGGHYGGGYGQGVPPRWNRVGSAVCPEFYDFHAYVGLCLPR